jgi:hypothetical protein
MMMDGGYDQVWRVVLWIVPLGATLPKPNPTVPANQIKFAKGKSARVIIGARFRKLHYVYQNSIPPKPCPCSRVDRERIRAATECEPAQRRPAFTKSLNISLRTCSQDGAHGTAAANDAAHYIAGEFDLMGLRPGLQLARAGRTRGENRARYLQSFPYVSGVTLGSKNSMRLIGSPELESVEYLVKESWMPLGFSSNASLNSASFVFAGFGISSAELKYDDYALSNVRGKIAVVFAGTPDRDNPHGEFAQAGQLRFKAAAARAAGAVALLIISEETNLKEERLAQLSLRQCG